MTLQYPSHVIVFYVLCSIYYTTYLWTDNILENLFKTKEYFWHKQVYGKLMKKER